MIRRMAAMTAGLVTAGCAYTGGAREFRSAELDGEPGWIAVRGVPEIRQRKPEDCGIAALAMVLAHWKASATTDEIEAACPAVPGKGSRAGDLRDFARRKGLQAFLLRGGPADFRKELGRGRPLLVGMIKPYASAALSHYEVVVAWHPERRIVVTIDPARGWRQTGWEDFVREWDPAQRLMLVVFPGREKPSS